jgi:hypothetical protein
VEPLADASRRPADRDLELAGDLMRAFAERTGLSGDRSPQRYLWTDAFAVCNCLGLWRATGAESFRRLALELIDQVHHVLGRHRPDDERRGWISGLPESEGELHPTRGGLRIGKRLPERPPGAAFDERLEWDRDGQYFHYLTRWMHALDQTARATGEPRFNAWARELADVAHRSFTRGSPAEGGRRMVWKMSTDLSRPLVPSMGQHDPLDGYVTCVELQATAAAFPDAPAAPCLDAAIAEFAGLFDGRSLATADPLGIGGLLMDAGRVAQLLSREELADGVLLEALLEAALLGLSQYAAGDPLRPPVSQRLAFRELGLAIGIAALDVVEAALRERGPALPRAASIRSHLARLSPAAGLGRAILTCWRDPAVRRDRTWAEHRDIDEAMLATALAPEGMLVVAGPGSERKPT